MAWGTSLSSRHLLVRKMSAFPVNYSSKIKSAHTASIGPIVSVVPPKEHVVTRGVSRTHTLTHGHWAVSDRRLVVANLEMISRSCC